VVALARAGHLAEATALFLKRPGQRGASNLITEQAKQRGDLDAAFLIYRTLVERSPPPNGIVINAMASACRRCGQPGRALALMDDIMRFDIALDKLGVSLLAAVCGEAGDATAANKLLAIIRQRQAGLIPNVTDCGQLVRALVAGVGHTTTTTTPCAAGSPGGGTSRHDDRMRLDAALSVLELMDQRKIPPDAKLFSMLLPLCTKLGDLEAGQQLHARILSSGIEVNNFLASALINLYARLGSLDDAVAEYNKLLATGQRPNPVVLNALASSYWRHSKPGEVVRLLSVDAEKLGVALDEMGFHLLAAACGETGDAQTAIKLLTRMRHRSEFKPDGADFGQLMKALVTYSDAPTDTTYSSTGRDDDRMRLDAALSMLELMDQRKIPPDVKICSMLLFLAMKAGDLEAGRRLHRRIVARHIEADSFLSSTLVNLYARLDSLDDALAEYKKLLATGQRPNQIALTGLASYFWRHGKPGEVVRLLSVDAEKLGVALDEMGFHLLAAACGETGDAQMAIKLLSRIDHFGFKPNAVDCAQLVRAILADNDAGSAQDHGGQVKRARLAQALSVVDFMDQNGIVPSTQHIFADLMSACGVAGELGLGQQLHARILERDVIPDDMTTAALISMYSQCGYLEASIGVFYDFKRLNHTRGEGQLQQQQGDVPKQGVSSWTAMIHALGQHGRGSEAVQLFHRMLQWQQTTTTTTSRDGEEPAPNEVTLIAVLNACSHAGLVDDALSIYESMARGSFRFEPDDRHHVCMVDVLGRAGRLDDAEKWINNHMKHHGGDPVVWKALLGACRKHGDVMRAERVAGIIHSVSPQDATSRVLLGNIYGKASQWLDKERVWEQMKQDGVKKIPGVSWIVVDGERHTFTVEDTKHPRAKDIHAKLNSLWAQIKEAGYQVNKAVVTRQFEDEEAKDCHLRQHSEKIAIAYGLMSTPPKTTLRVFKNLRVCPDCHEATKHIAKVTGRQIILRDANRFHHFSPYGQCSCGDYW